MQHVDPAKILSTTSSLPSLPAVATRIIEYANDSNVSISKLADLVNKDPAIACKVLRLVNSPLYVKPRPVETVHQAIVIMGLNQTISVALSFSLLTSLGEQQGEGLDYEHYWKRSLLAATSAKAMGEHLGLLNLEELFLAALIQDIGMLALDRVEHGFYQALGDAQHHHDELITYEKERMGIDHAELGGDLLQKWHLPERTWSVVKHSHNPDYLLENSVYSQFGRVVALSGQVADLFLNNEKKGAFTSIGHMAYSLLRFDHHSFQRIIQRIGELIPDIEILFSASLVSQEQTETILTQARDMLVDRNLEALQEVDKLQQVSKSLGNKFQVVEESGYHDLVTGVYNRSYLDNYLPQVLSISKQTGKPVSIGLIALKGLRAINDEFGHKAGDQILRAAAKVIRSCVPESCVIARYGGGEFVVTLPGVSAEEMVTYAQGLGRERTYTLVVNGEPRVLPIDFTLGLATHGQDQEYGDTEALFSAAEASVQKTLHKTQTSQSHQAQM